MIQPIAITSDKASRNADAIHALCGPGRESSWRTTT